MCVRVKKLWCAALALLLVAGLLGGCSKQEDEVSDVSSEITATPQPESEETGSYRVGLVQYMEYAPYDKAREAFMSRLEEWGFNDSRLQVDYQNAGGDADKLTEICEKFVNDKDRVVVAISTPAAEAAVKACEGTEIQVVFLGVNEPHNELGMADPANPDGNITGVTDLVASQAALELALQVDGGLNTVGLFYNPTCPFGDRYVEAMKTACSQRGIDLVEGPVTDPAEAAEKMKLLCEQADAIFSPVDSTIGAASEEAAQAALEAKKPWYASTEDVVTNGALAGISIDYAEAGNKAADLTVQLVAGKKVSELPVYAYTLGKTYVNPQTLDSLGVTMPEEVLKTANYREKPKEAS